MRDMDRWKDKVELSLDGRQIFFLFFGSAVAACLIFVVGILCGKRMEARALAMQPAPVDDPLAALDQLGELDDPAGLTFQRALTKGAEATSAKKESTVESRLDPKAIARTDARAEPKPEARPEMKADAKPEGKSEAKPETKIDAKPEARADAKAEKKPQKKIDAEVAAKPEPKLAARADKPARSDAIAKVEAKELKKPEGEADLADTVEAEAHPGRTVPVDKPAGDKPAPDKGARREAASHFTLQLSAFPEKADAEEFMHRIQAAGYRPFVVASEIPNKGVFYRVRVGDYSSRQAALDAKAEFERKQRLIAYVAKL
jgi:hypothetical protein